MNNLKDTSPENKIYFLKVVPNPWLFSVTNKIDTKIY